MNSIKVKFIKIYSDIPLAVNVLRKEGVKSFFIRCYFYFFKGERAPCFANNLDAQFSTKNENMKDRLLFYEDEQNYQLPQTDIKILVFYFPQFHPFLENDTFWGKGFTEWTNVTKSKPLFNGHFQPRLPGELGFYDTRIKEVLTRQIEMAKTHGIHGICFHHYWFMGRKVMRVPYDMMMANPDLDIPFCLHWANEPWTVRWDGYGTKGVLLEQKHTPDDDMDFIKDIEPALRDSRYIRVEGRPLLIVYRPSLFPDIKATIDRWNRYCERQGIGKLYLAVMQTCFESDMDPTEYGFDAAIEYPPHNMGLLNVNESVRFFEDGFTGNVYSFPNLVAKNKKRIKPSYKLFRGIIPGWDCTPRRKNADLFIDQSPWLYQEWLESHIDYTEKNLPTAERFIFVNAWNEWAEGAYLEPDRHFGYAYLNATGRALLSRQQKMKIAVVLHIFYVDLLDEFITYFKNIPYDFDLHVSTSVDQLENVREKLFEYIGNKKVKIYVFPNKGRDMGPFVVGFRDIYQSYDLVCFVHSKKSCIYGDNLQGWRSYLLSNLMGSADIVQNIIDYFANDSKLGMICPDTFPPVMNMHDWGGNREGVQFLARQMDLSVDFSSPPDFPAGSMFWFRPQALKPIFELDLSFADFEDRSEEKTDGTLAHAFERLFFYVVEKSGFNWQRILFMPAEKDRGDLFAPAIKKDIQRVISDQSVKIAVILHLYYEDLSEEFQAYLNNIPLKYDLFVSTNEKADEENLEKVFRNCKNLNQLEIISFQNKGRDIYPFLKICDKNQSEKYDLICKIHSKKSLFTSGHKKWRNYLLENLLGSSHIVKTIIYYFLDDMKIGMVYPRTYQGVQKYNDQDPWRNNWSVCSQLASQLDIQISRGMSLDFPAGSMFWCRPEALLPLIKLQLESEDFDDESKQLDGTLAHGIERMFGLVSVKAGFYIRKILIKEDCQ